MRPGTIGHRVLSRFVERRPHGTLGILPEPLQVVLADGGVVTARDVERLLAPFVGDLAKLRFLAPQGAAIVAPNAVAWEAMSTAGETIEGTLTFHAALTEQLVETWVELTVNGWTSSLKMSASMSSPRARLRAIGELGRDLIARIRDTATVPWIEVVAEIVKIVDLAERDAESS